MSFLQIKNQLESQIRSLEGSINSTEIDTKAVKLIERNLINATSKLGNDLPSKIGSELESTFAGFKALTSSIDDVIEGFDDSKLTQVAGQLNVAQLTDKIPLIKDQLIPAVGDAASDLQKIVGGDVQEALLDVVIALPTPEAIAATVKEIADPTKDVIENITKELVNLEEPMKKLASGLQGPLFQAASSLQGPLKQVAGNLSQSVDGILGPLSAAAGDLEHAFSVDLKSMEKEFSAAIGDITGIADNLSSLKLDISNTITQDVQNALRKVEAGFGSITENIVEDLLSPAKVLMGQVATIKGIQIDIDDAKIREIIELVQAGKVNTATKVLQKYSDLPAERLLNVVKALENSNKLSTVLKDKVDTFTVNTTDLAVEKNKWQGVNTPNSAFTIIGTKEELEAEILSAEREITEVIVHHTFTGLNQNLDAGDINDYSKDVYGDGIPYHYVITREGNIERGRPIDKETISLINNHQQHSIHIAFVGGVNAPIGSRNMPDVEKWLSKKSFTPNQWKAFDRFLQAAYATYPGLQVMGHSTIDASQLDPGFDVVEYVYSKYGKKSLFYQPQNQPPLSRDEIVSRIGPQ